MIEPLLWTFNPLGELVYESNLHWMTKILPRESTIQASNDQKAFLAVP